MHLTVHCKNKQCIINSANILNIAVADRNIQKYIYKDKYMKIHYIYRFFGIFTHFRTELEILADQRKCVSLLTELNCEVIHEKSLITDTKEHLKRNLQNLKVFLGAQIRYPTKSTLPDAGHCWASAPDDHLVHLTLKVHCPHLQQWLMTFTAMAMEQVSSSSGCSADIQHMWQDDYW